MDKIVSQDINRKDVDRKMEMQVRICVTRKELPALLGCGQQAADRVAREAKATIRVGKRILISLPKLEKYIEEVAQ